MSDANLLLGRLDPDYFNAGRMRLDPELSRRAAAGLAERMRMDELSLAASIVEITNENMASAIKMISLERGHDPRRFSLLAFGGAGGLHAPAIARSMGIPRVIIPPFPGMFSALGLLMADLRVDKVWTQAFRSTDIDADVVNRQFHRITERAVSELRAEGFAGDPTIRRAINMRYLGQNYEHEVDIPTGEIDTAALEAALRRFDDLHAARYGYLIEGEVIELVSFRVSAIGSRPSPPISEPPPAGDYPRRRQDVHFRAHGTVEALFVHRSSIRPGEVVEGPAIVLEEGCTTLVEPGMRLTKSPEGSLIIDLEAGR